MNVRNKDFWYFSWVCFVAGVCAFSGGIGAAYFGSFVASLFTCLFETIAFPANAIEPAVNFCVVCSYCLLIIICVKTIEECTEKCT